MKYLGKGRMSLFFIVFICNTISGQMSKSDSLVLILEQYEREDTTKINLLNSAAFALLQTDKSKAITYVDASMKMSEELNYLKGKANSYWIKGLIATAANPEEALNNLQEALKIAEVIDDKTGQCNYLIAIGNVEKRKGQLKQCNKTYERALDIARQMHNNEQIIKCSINISQNQMIQGNYLDAAIKLQESITLASQDYDYVLLSSLYSNLASVNLKMGNYPVALNYYLSALKINEQFADKNGIFMNLINIAGIQSDHQETGAAVETMDKALALANEYNDSIKLSVCYTNLGNIYKKVDKEKALDYFDRALSIAQYNNAAQAINLYTSIGSVYCDLNLDKKAVDYLQKGLEEASKRNMKLEYSQVCQELGRLYYQSRNYPLAIDYTLKAKNTSGQIQYREVEKDAYKQLSSIYAQTGNYKNAYDYQLLYTQLNDSLYNEKNLKKIALLESDYAFSKEREAYEYNKMNGELLINKQHLWIRMLLIISILVILLAVMIYRWGVLKKRILSLKINTISNELAVNRSSITVAQLKLVQNAERDAQTLKMLEQITDTITGKEKAAIQSIIGNYKQEALYANWEEFEKLFTEYNAAFWQELNKKYPDLTPNERRLCVFMRLNMNNKEIAKITFQTEDALKKSRMRLRRKFDIDRSTNLALFIQSI